MGKKFLSVLMALAVTCTMQSFAGMPEVKAAEVHSVGTTYYLSSRNGDNSKSGTSQNAAWETLDKLEGLQLKPGDQILLEKGSIFNGTIHLKDVSGEEDAPIVIGSYGDGDQKPMINGNGQGIWYQDYNAPMDNTAHKSNGYVSSAILLYDVDYVEVRDLEITNDSNDFDYFGTNIKKQNNRMDRTGIAGMAKDGGTMKHIYLEDLYIHDVAGNIEDKHMNNGGIQMNVSKPEDEASTGIARYEDIKIRNCYVKDVSRAGIVMGYTYQHSKFNGQAIKEETMEQYGHTNILIEGNYVQNAGNDAICVMYSLRPVVQYNVSDRAGVDLDTYQGDYHQPFCAAIWPWKTKDAVFQYNEAFDTTGKYNGDGQAWDIDYSDGTVYQYNYSHGNGGGAMLVCLDEAYNGTLRYNISQNDLKCFLTLQGNPMAKIYNNVFYVGGDLKTAVHHNQSGKRGGSAYLANNIFYNVSSQKAVTLNEDGSAAAAGWTPGNQTFENNIYFGYSDSGMPQLPEEHPITADPKFTDPGTAPEAVQANGSAYGRDVFNGYKIADDSPAVNAGVFAGDVKEDFFGNSITGICPDIGVHETGVPEQDTVRVFSEKYTVTEDSILGITINTSLAQFLKNIRYSENATCTVFNGDEELTGNDRMISDRMTLKVEAGGKEAVYTLRVESEYVMEGMTAEAGSEQTGETADKALDGNINTMWHTAWAGCSRAETWITIDMGKVQDVATLKYVPRQAGGTNGIITKYKVEVSADKQEWTQVAAGNWASNTQTKYAEFDRISTRYVKLTALESVSQEAGVIFASAAELGLSPLKQQEVEK